MALCCALDCNAVPHENSAATCSPQIKRIELDKPLEHALSTVTCADYWCTLFDFDDGTCVSDMVEYNHCLRCLFVTSSW